LTTRIPFKTDQERGTKRHRLLALDAGTDEKEGGVSLTFLEQSNSLVDDLELGLSGSEHALDEKRLDGRVKGKDLG
jgi:hypothetical protein